VCYERKKTGCCLASLRNGQISISRLHQLVYLLGIEGLEEITFSK